jgi:hypothetical protein
MCLSHGMEALSTVSFTGRGPFSLRRVFSSTRRDLLAVSKFIRPVDGTAPHRFTGSMAITSDLFSDFFLLLVPDSKKG